MGVAEEVKSATERAVDEAQSAFEDNSQQLQSKHRDSSSSGGGDGGMRSASSEGASGSFRDVEEEADRMSEKVREV